MSSEQNVQRVGDYEILGVLGAGGMGKVYKVRNVISDRIEAMKVLLPDLAGQKELAERFLREIKLLASLNHPNIASLRTALTIGNQLVMIMEFVEGETLSARLQHGPVPPVDAVDYIGQVLMALSYAHRQHIIHRDIKPANMMLTPQGLVKLMDFGIARSSEDRGLTMTGTTLGSLYYMSPEQIKGEGVDARSDLYSVGVSLYELVTGRRPFQAESNYSLMAAHLQEAPKPPIDLQPSLPGGLNQIILMAMAKDPGQRFQSAEAFDAALRSIASTLPKRVGGVAPSAAGPVGATAAFQESAPGPAAAEVTAPATAAAPAPPAAPPPHLASAQPAAPVVAAMATAAPPAPRVSPSVMAPRRTSRGLYMTLGALLVVAVLAFAAIYGPRWARTRASGSAAQQTQPPSSSTPSGTPANPPASPTDAGGGAQPAGSSSTAAPSAESSSPASPAPAAQRAGAEPSGATAPGGAEASRSASPSEPAASRPPRKPSATEAAGRQAAPSSSASGATSGAKPASAPQDASEARPDGGAAQTADSAALDELEQRSDQLSSRAGSVKDSIDKLRNEMAAQGGNLRGDINASEQRMETAMSRAQTALQSQDSRKTKQYLDQAETEVEKLEKFLGQR